MKVGVLAVMILAGCGGNDVTPDASTPTDASPDAAGQQLAEVAVAEGTFQGTDTTLALAGFGIDSSSTTASRDDGPCHIEQRVKGAATFVSAGTVTISGVGGTITLVPDGSNNYATMLAGLKYAAGTALTIAATGGAVPAFSGMLTFPATLTITSPTMLTTLHKSGFMATWSPITGSVVVRINQYPSMGPETHIDCTFDGMTGTGSVPSTALTELLTTVSGSVAILTEAKTTTAAGAYTVTLDGLFSGFQTSVTIQP